MPGWLMSVKKLAILRVEAPTVVIAKETSVSDHPGQEGTQGDQVSVESMCLDDFIRVAKAAKYLIRYFIVNWDYQCWYF